MSTLPPLPSMMKTGIPMEYFDAVAEYAEAYAQAALSAQRESLIEQCAKVCENERVEAEETQEDTDKAYNLALKHAAAAIRALQPERGEG